MVLSIKQHSLFQLINAHLIEYPTPSNLTLFWNYGFLAAMCLVTQLLSGIALAMHFTPHVDLAFLSVEHIMRDVNGGWLIRYIHANGASMFFITVYVHIARGLYYGSYMQPRGLVWSLGVIILILMMATAFMGYVLVWGQMSFWAATVITNFFTAFPIVGDKIVTLLWGGFSVDNATLNRFFSLHYLLPFLIAGVVVVHMAAVHNDGSNNPLGISSHADKIAFFPYFFIKDTLGLVGGLIFFSFWVYYAPNSLGHPDNYIPANPMSTPEHIVPEWYFLFAYAILRSIPNKLMGVLALFASLLVLLVLPVINTSAVRSSLYRPLYQKFFWFLVADFFLLSYLGQAPAESPYIEVGQVATVYYFSFFIILVPILGRLEKGLISVRKV
uniref:Cytochrome b n=1 Tax=Phaeocystis antarctica TaxID=33657 RepID=G9FIQ2_9EUKA|nr:apocytochrome b [Phaeocystis antarctica]